MPITVRLSAFPVLPIRALLCAASAFAMTACLASRSDSDVVTSSIHRAVALDRIKSLGLVENQRLIPGGRVDGLGDPRREDGDMRTTQTVDPTGSYDFALTDHGVQGTGSMSVEGTPGAYTGTIKAEGKPDVSISTLTASGPLVTVTGDVPQGVLLLRFRMTGDSLRGDWSLRGQGGSVVGKRQRRGGAK